MFYSSIIFDYSATRVLWIAQNAGGSSADYQEVDSIRFEREHTMYIWVLITCLHDDNFVFLA